MTLWQRWVLTAFAIATLTAGVPARAAGGGGGGDATPSTPVRVEDPDYTAAVKAIKAASFGRAIPLLEGVVTREPKNADAFNWLAYATRRSGDAAKSIPIYQKALAIDPDHRGAHEYIGEAYLGLGDLPKAREHLARLNKLCFLPCSEYRDLKKAVQAYEKSNSKVKPTAAK